MAKHTIIEGFSTHPIGMRILTFGTLGVTLFFNAKDQKKAFVEVHKKEVSPEMIKLQFGGEQELQEEAEKLFGEEKFEKTFEKIIRAMADQSNNIKKTQLRVIKKVFIS